MLNGDDNACNFGPELTPVVGKRVRFTHAKIELRRTLLWYRYVVDVNDNIVLFVAADVCTIPL